MLTKNWEVAKEKSLTKTWKKEESSLRRKEVSKILKAVFVRVRYCDKSWGHLGHLEHFGLLQWAERWDASCLDKITKIYYTVKQPTISSGVHVV